MVGRLFVSAVGGACIGMSLSLAGYLIGGLPGELVGLFLAVPASMLFAVAMFRR